MSNYSRKFHRLQISFTETINFSDPAGLADRPEFAKVLVQIRKCIENGSPLPSNYYRKGSTTTPDTLLATHGIMHLHLGRPNTSELLYLVQYDDHVVLLELSDHAHLQTKPKGARLVSRHGVPIGRKEAEFDALSQEALPKRRKIVLPPRRGPRKA